MQQIWLLLYEIWQDIKIQAEVQTKGIVTEVIFWP